VSTAAILTGSRAARFGGRDKSALVIEGRSILERRITELLHVTDDVLLVGEPPAETGSGRLLFELVGERHRLLANVNTPADYEELGEVLCH
jgi:molybdopterin-guanine dinucleotide biosynthesis protein A